MRYGRSVENGFLPIYSVDTEEEAQMLLRTACDTNVAGEFVARELAADQTIDNLFAFGERLAHMHAMIQQRAQERENDGPRHG